MDRARKTDSAPGHESRTASLKVRRKLIAAMVSAAWAVAGSSAALAVPETEPNNTFPGQASLVGTTYDGFLCSVVGTCASPDDIDFYHYSGLTSGDAFDLTGTEFGFGATFTFGLYSDATTVLDSVSVGNGGLPGHLTGLVPASGELTFGVTSGAIGIEGYTVVLDATHRAPEPASVALLAAGLAGAFIARRRKRS